MIVHNYVEQNEGDNFELDEDKFPGGLPVTIQIWKCVRVFNPDVQHYIVASSTPVITVICASLEYSWAEYPGMRDKKVTQDLQIARATDLQQMLYQQLHLLIEDHNGLVFSRHNDAQYIQGLEGVIACGTMVRFYKVRLGEKEMGWMKSRTVRGLDLVNGVPSDAMGAVEKALNDIKAVTAKKKG